MNKQGKLINGKVVGGIEWVKTVLPDGTERQGYTWNPVGGCQHGCRWTMPDGSEAICYAEAVATRVAQKAYPNGFEHHYWRPEVLNEPLEVETPSRIFMDSMSDLMGHWVPDEQIRQVLDVCRQAHWHTFQLLTKNAPRLLRFEFPPNVWVGVSAPPSTMFGKPLSDEQQLRMLKVQMETLGLIGARVAVRWMSAEPLSWGLTQGLWACDPNIDWLVIGAASNGPRVYQPEPGDVDELLYWADMFNIPVFFKGNLAGNTGIDRWREDFPSAPVLPGFSSP